MDVATGLGFLNQTINVAKTSTAKAEQTIERQGFKVLGGQNRLAARATLASSPAVASRHREIVHYDKSVRQMEYSDGPDQPAISALDSHFSQHC